MPSELLTLYGETDGSSTTGTFSLTGPGIYGSVTEIQIPRGMKAKIWCKRISGSVATDVIIEYSPDGGSTWVTIGREVLASPGEVAIEKRRPIVVESINGVEKIRVSWSQSTAGKAYIELEVEITDD